MRAGVLVLLAGCDVVFPTHEPPPPPGPTEVVTGTFLERRVTNTTQRVPILSDDPMAGVAGTAILPDGSRVELHVDTQGQFAFERPVGAPYRVILEDPLEPQEIQHDAPTLGAARVSVARVTAVPKLATPITLPAGTTTIASMGQWSFTPLAPGVTTFDWREARPRGNVPVGLVDGVAGDDLLLLAFENTGKGLAIAKAVDVRIKMTDGLPRDLSVVPLAATPANSCGSLKAPDRPATANRFHEAIAGELAPFDDYLLLGVFEPRVGPFAGIDLMTLDEPSPSALDLTIDFYKPLIPALHTLASFGAGATVERGLPGVAPARLAVEWRVFDAMTEAAAGSAQCAANPTMLASDLGTAAHIAFDGAELVDEQQPVVLPEDRDPVLTWMVDGGDGELYSVRVFHLVALDGATALEQERVIHTTQPRATIDRTLLAPGESYVVSVTAFRGYPGVATGDFAQVTYPYARSTTFSTVFQAN